jgi:hypothetical protein
MFGAAVHAAVSLMLGIQFGMTLGSTGNESHALLPGLLSRVRRFRAMVMLSNNPLGWLYALALLLGLVLILLLVTLILAVVAAGIRRAFPGPLDAMAGGIGFLPVSTMLFPLVAGLLSGYLIAAIRSRRAVSGEAVYVKAIEEEVDGMLKMMQNRFDFEGDERPHIPQLGFRPAGELTPRLPINSGNAAPEFPAAAGPEETPSGKPVRPPGDPQ